ncbi:MAG TPA: hypothetical protein VGK26_11135 [Thermoanaerobaculia bacterium]|jgi:hypothetical protein
MRLGVYDDSLLLLGARLSGAGWLPYRDFYSHYGPLGFAALAPLLKWLVNPGVTLRVAQSAGLIGLVVLLGLAARRSGARLGSLALPAAAAALSPAFAVPAFLGYGFAAGAAALFLCGEAEAGPPPRSTWPWTVAAGALLAACALTRPAFAAYVAAAIVAVELAVFGRDSIRRLLVGLAAASAVAGILWVALFRHIDLREALVAVTIAPARLMARRHVDPGLAREDLVLTLPIAAAIAAGPLLWAFAAPSRAGRRLWLWIAVCAIALGAAAPLLLRHPVSGLPPTALAGVAFAASVLLAWLSRDALGSSPSLRAAAVLGASAAAFGHYFWSRPDVQHLYPLLGLSAVSAAFAWERFGGVLRAVTVAALLLAFFPLDPGPGFPGGNLFRGGIASIRENAARPGARLKTIWPAGEVPSPPVEAVRLADRLADRGSRFVAYGNAQSWTPGDPVYLFLLSSRLPYTKWFQYDPGLQSSPPIQEAMIRELEASGSRSAVVWRSESYYFDPPPPGTAVRSPFDAYVDRVYANVVGRFGNYEVRTRD